MTILLGASGAGKSVVLKLILGLLKPDSGMIHVNGNRIDTMSEAAMMQVRDDIGMLFQESALFDSLTVAGDGLRLPVPWRRGRGCCCSTSQRRASTRLRRSPSTPRSSSCAICMSRPCW